MDACFLKEIFFHQLCVQNVLAVDTELRFWHDLANYSLAGQGGACCDSPGSQNGVQLCKGHRLKTVNHSSRRP